jgi:beta-galactosidase/beta-glucuronidase
MTRWARDVSPANVHREYPRPTLVRERWLNLNGLWDFAIVSTNSPHPHEFEGKILVPFPVESALSGVKRMVGSSNRLWYHRTFKVPGSWKGKRIMLNFGAVDWDSTVWVNGQQVGAHQGGYDAFACDITAALKKGEQELVVSVWDPTDDGPQPRGKQVKKPGSIWYTPTTGIWQTAWLEPVEENAIERLKLTPDFDSSELVLSASVTGAAADVVVEAIALDGKKKVGSGRGKSGEVFRLKVPNARSWSPDAPFLYDLRVTVKRRGKTLDSVSSYFGMRKSSLARDEKGVLRMQLNNKPLFQVGPLDQGFWPDGLYTAPTDEALRSDIEMTKRLGFNMARKHVKVEPERWYYWCDKLGLLVWQDMPSGDKSARWQGPSGFDGVEMQRSPASAGIYERELKSLLDGRHNHPSIVTWVPFNEGWGQFETVRILDWTAKYDPSRLVDGASGGNHFPAGHILDHHQYPGPGAPKPVADRAMVLGEFGGLGLPVKGHTWQEEKNWGYRNFKSAEEVTHSYLELIDKLQPMIRESGLSAAIYTQTTDVEIEVNGLMTYDRAIVKMDEAKIKAANSKLYLESGGSK